MLFCLDRKEEKKNESEIFYFEKLNLIFSIEALDGPTVNSGLWLGSGVLIEECEVQGGVSGGQGRDAGEKPSQDKTEPVLYVSQPPFSVPQQNVKNYFLYAVIMAAICLLNETLPLPILI